MADAHAMYDEAEKLKDDSKYQEAIAKYLEILGTDDSFTLAHLALAVTYGKVGDFENAVKHGERACQLEPNDPFSFTAMSVTYQQLLPGLATPSTSKWPNMRWPKHTPCRGNAGERPLTLLPLRARRFPLGSFFRADKETCL